MELGRLVECTKTDPTPTMGAAGGAGSGNLRPGHPRRLSPGGARSPRALPGGHRALRRHGGVRQRISLADVDQL